MKARLVQINQGPRRGETAVLGSLPSFGSNPSAASGGAGGTTREGERGRTITRNEGAREPSFGGEDAQDEDLQELLNAVNSDNWRDCLTEEDEVQAAHLATDQNTGVKDEQRYEDICEEFALKTRESWRQLCVKATSDAKLGTGLFGESKKWVGDFQNKDREWPPSSIKIDKMPEHGKLVMWQRNLHTQVLAASNRPDDLAGEWVNMAAMRSYWDSELEPTPMKFIRLDRNLRVAIQHIIPKGSNIENDMTDEEESRARLGRPGMNSLMLLRLIYNHFRVSDHISQMNAQSNLQWLRWLGDSAHQMQTYLRYLNEFCDELDYDHNRRRDLLRRHMEDTKDESLRHTIALFDMGAQDVAQYAEHFTFAFLRDALRRRIETMVRTVNANRLEKSFKDRLDEAERKAGRGSKEEPQPTRGERRRAASQRRAILVAQMAGEAGAKAKAKSKAKSKAQQQPPHQQPPPNHSGLTQDQQQLPPPPPRACNAANDGVFKERKARSASPAPITPLGKDGGAGKGKGNKGGKGGKGKGDKGKGGKQKGDGGAGAGKGKPRDESKVSNDPKVVWDSLKARMDDNFTPPRRICLFYWTNQGCKNQGECRFSHARLDKNGFDLVGKKEFDLATKYIKENPPRAQSKQPARDDSRRPQKKRDDLGMCFKENFGKTHCTDENCPWKHRNPHKSKNPKASIATAEEKARLPKP